MHRAAEFKPEDVERAVRILEQHDPRRMKGGALRTLTIRGEDLDLVVNYLANRYGKGSSRIVLQPGVLSLAASVEVPGSPLGRFVNVQATLHETAGMPAFDQLRIGRLPVPGLARRLGARPRDADARSHRGVSGSPPTPSAASASPTEACGWSTSGATICRRDWAT